MIRRPHLDLSDPTSLVRMLVAGQVVLWTLAPALTHSAPPLDVVESIMWGREWVLATYKHPAMPSWVLQAFWQLTGSVGWPAYFASQLFIAATFVLVFLLGRDLMGPARAAAGTLLLTGVAYYAWPTVEFNHNVAETPLWAGLPFALWRAVERRSIVWWVLAGAFAAGGLYAKLSTGLLLATAAAWLVFDADARRSLATAGPYVGLAVFVVLVIPLDHWLLVHDFLPFKHAAHRMAQPGGRSVPAFLANVALNLAGMLVILTYAGLIGKRAKARSADQPAAGEAPVGRRERHFLAIFTAGPLLLALLGATIAQSGLKTAWGSSMFNLAGLWAIAAISHRFRQETLWRIGTAAFTLLVVLPIGYALVVAFAPRFASPMRVNWPQAEISRRMTAIWQAQTNGRPLRIVSGDTWVAGLVGITAKDRPSILNLGDLSLTPWIDRARLDAEGMLIVWDARTGRIPAALKQIVASGTTGEEEFSWPRNSRRPNIVIAYRVVPPKAPPR